MERAGLSQARLGTLRHQARGAPSLPGLGSKPAAHGGSEWSGLRASGWGQGEVGIGSLAQL